MKTQEEINNLLKAVQLVTKELNNAINSENSNDRTIIAMMLMSFLPTLNEFMAVLKKEMNNTEEETPSSEDPLDNLLHQVTPNETPS